MRRFITYAAVASVLTVLIIRLFIHVNSQVDLLADNGYDEVYVPNGKCMQALFWDGSKAHSNSGSRIRHPKKFGLPERKVCLGGRVWFEVAKNKDRPFTMDTSYMDIKTLSITFGAEAYPKEEAVFVALKAGSIELKPRPFKSYQLRPRKRAVYNKASGHCEIFRSHDVKVYSTWRRSMPVFKNTPLSDVMRTLTRTYDTSFDMGDSTVLWYTYTITTDSTSLATILKELEEVTSALFKKKGGKIGVRVKE